MIKVYGSSLCPDCINFEYNLKKNQIAYEFIDIHESMKNLKAFLRIRDNQDVFDDAKSKGYVGIPAIVYEDASIELDWEKYLENQGIAVVSCDQESQEFPASCDISGKGC